MYSSLHYEHGAKEQTGLILGTQCTWTNEEQQKYNVDFNSVHKSDPLQSTNGKTQSCLPHLISSIIQKRNTVVDDLHCHHLEEGIALAAFLIHPKNKLLSEPAVSKYHA